MDFKRTKDIKTALNIGLVGNEFEYVDKVTFKKKFDGRKLGVCIATQLHLITKLPILHFTQPFLGFTWQYQSNCRKINK